MELSLCLLPVDELGCWCRFGTVWQAYRGRKMVAVWLFAFVAVVFNLLAPLYLRSDIWQIVDLVVAI